MKRNLLKPILATLALILGVTGAWAEVGDKATVVEQTFTESTVLTSTSDYTWGSKLSGMLKSNGLYVTNASNAANNYENRDFLTFTNAVGDDTHEVNLTYEVYSPKDKSQANTYYTISYFDANDNFIFSIQEYSGGWKYGSNIVYATSDGTTKTVALANGHMKKAGGSVVSLSVKYAGENAIVTIDGNTYSAYAQNKGIKSIKLSVSGGNGYDRDMYIKNYKVETTEIEAIKVAKYVLNYVVGATTIKTVEKSDIVGSAINLADNEKAPFFNEEKTQKYIYVSDDASGKTVAEDGSTVVTVTFREAGKWAYTVKSNDGTELVNGENFEGEVIYYNYPRYILGADSIIYAESSYNPGSRQFCQKSFTLTENNQVVELTYNATTTGRVAFYSEAEAIETLTTSTAASSDIRCSNGLCAYNSAEEPAVLCYLTAGTYKLYTSTWGTADTDFIFSAGENAILTASTTGSINDYTSEEFTVNWKTPITLAQTTNAGRGIDFIYIQKVADAEELVDPKAPRTWEFNKMYAEDEALLAADTENWTQAKGGRYQNANVAFNKEVIKVNDTELKTTKDLLFTAEATKLLLGTAGGGNAYIQLQKGSSFVVPGLTAGDTVRAVVKPASKSAATLAAPASTDARIIEGFEASTAQHTCTVVMKKDGELTIAGDNADIRVITLELIRAEYVPEKAVFADKLAYTISKNQYGQNVVNITITAPSKYDSGSDITGTMSIGMTEAPKVKGTANALSGNTLVENVNPGDPVKLSFTDQGDYLAAGKDTLVFTVGAMEEVGYQLIGSKDYELAIVIPKNVATIAELKACENNELVSLTLTDAIVTSHINSNNQSYSYIQDATGGMKVNSKISNLFGEIGEGAKVNGTLAGKVSIYAWNNLPTLNNESTVTSADGLTITQGEVTNKAITLAEVAALASKADTIALQGVRYELSNLTMQKVADGYNTTYYLLDANENKIILEDDFFLWESVPEFSNISKMSGYFMLSYYGELQFHPYPLSGIEAEYKPATPVASIKEMKEQPLGTNVKLTLKDAKITLLEPGWFGNTIIIEDATGAVQLGNGLSWAEDITTRGQVVNGTVYCKYYSDSGTQYIVDGDSAAFNTLKTDSIAPSITGKSVSIPNAKNADYTLRFVKFGMGKITVEEDPYWGEICYFVQGNDTISLQDQFYKYMNPETNENLLPKEVKSMSGFIFQDPVYDETYQLTGYDYYFVPFEHEDLIIKEFTEDYKLKTTKENVTALLEEGWIYAGTGITEVTKKKGNIDVETGAPLAKAETIVGIGLKKGGATKTFAAYITGVELVRAYGVSNSGEERYIVVTATSLDGGDAITSQVGNAQNITSVVDVTLDPAQRYYVEFTGTDGAETGKDVTLQSVWFVKDKNNIPTAITEIESNVTTLTGNVYSINGLKVRNAGESLNGLAKGIYIINNKKVVVK